MTDIKFHGIDHDELAEALAIGVDHGGNPIAPFIDPEGGWPLRCCLGRSRQGDKIAIIAWSPYPWHGPYRETGPVVVHTAGCSGSAPRPSLPQTLNDRPYSLRPYGREHTILYDLVIHLDEGDDVSARTLALFDDPSVVEVYAKNRTGGCFAFAARREA